MVFRFWLVCGRFILLVAVLWRPILVMAQPELKPLAEVEADPEDWDTAYASLQTLQKRISELRIGLDRSNAQSRQRILQEYVQATDATIARLRLTLSLNGPVAPGEQVERDVQVTNARCFLAFVFASDPSQRYVYDSALLSEYVARHSPYSPNSAEAAHVAMVSWLTAYNASPAARRAQSGPIFAKRDDPIPYELGRAISIGEYYVRLWPRHVNNDHARFVLGNLYGTTQQYLKAIQTYESISAESPNQLQIQINTGSLYWKLFTHYPALAPADVRPVEEVRTWPTKARHHLQQAVAIWNSRAPRNSELPAIKLDLAATLNYLRDHEGVLKLFSDAERSTVLTLQQAMPRAGSEVPQVIMHREIWRAEVGLNQLDAAREQFSKLNRLAPFPAVNEFTQFNTLKRVGDEIRSRAQTRNAEIEPVLASHAAFLEHLLSHKDFQDVSSQNWCAMCYSTIGQSLLDGGHEQAVPFLEKSLKVFNSLDARPEGDANPLTAPVRKAVGLRIVTLLRKLKRFDEARIRIVEMLRVTPEARDIQVEAATISEDQAIHAAKSLGALGHWERALNGDASPTGLIQLEWGWELLAQKSLEELRGASAAKKAIGDVMSLMGDMRDARYHAAKCRLEIGRRHPVDAECEKQFATALADLTSAVSQVPEFIKFGDHDQFNQLYREVRRENNALLTRLGKTAEVVPVADLPRPDASAEQKFTVPK